MGMRAGRKRSHRQLLPSVAPQQTVVLTHSLTENGMIPALGLLLLITIVNIGAAAPYYDCQHWTFGLGLGTKNDQIAPLLPPPLLASCTHPSC